MALRGTPQSHATQFTLILSVCLLTVFFIVSSSFAGQVVTEDVKGWAKKALQEEATLQLPTGKNTLGVLYFHNRTGDTDLDPVQKGMALMLITDLSKLEEIQVVERIKLQALVEEMGLGTSGLVDTTTAPRVGKLLGARWLSGGDITGKPAQLTIQSHLLDVPAQTASEQPPAQGSLDELFRIEKDILFGIIKTMGISVSPDKERQLRQPCSTKTEALMGLFKGIEASDKENYEKAASYYEKALKEDPGICIARDALNELKQLGLIGAQKRSPDVLKSLRNDTSLTDQIAPEDATRRERTPVETGGTRTSPTDFIIHFP